MISGLGARTSLAIGAFLLTSVTNVTAPLFAAIAIYATLGLLNRPVGVREEPSLAYGAAVVLALAGGGLLADYQNIPFGDPVALTLWLACVAAAVVVPFWWARSGDSRVLYLLLWVLLACVSLSGARLILSAQEGGAASDVYAFHEAAALALEAGEDPYQAARVINTDPNVRSGAIVTGYPYPPIAMTPMVASSSWFGDSRWILLVAWVGMIAVLGTRAIASGGALFQSVLLLGLFPAFRVTLFVAWTEVFLLGIAALLVLGSAGPGPLTVWRTVVLGALASSKQYMVFLAPVVLVVRSIRIPVSLAAVALTGATLLPYLMIEPESMYHSLYENLAVISDRPDSFSISGMLQTLGVTTGGLPRIAWIAITLLFGLAIARKVRDVSDFVLAAALVLGFAFLTGVAFVNYWLLCAGLVLVGSIMKAGQSPV